jgi:hypothetical protein
MNLVQIDKNFFSSKAMIVRNFYTHWTINIWIQSARSRSHHSSQSCKLDTNSVSHRICCGRKKTNVLQWYFCTGTTIRNHSERIDLLEIFRNSEKLKDVSFTQIRSRTGKSLLFHQRSRVNGFQLHKSSRSKYLFMSIEVRGCLTRIRRDCNPRNQGPIRFKHNSKRKKVMYIKAQASLM